MLLGSANPFCVPGMRRPRGGKAPGMDVWRIRRHAEGTWQVLTPVGTQACARSTSRAEAISKARALMAFEGAHDLRIEEPAAQDPQRS